MADFDPNGYLPKNPREIPKQDPWDRYYEHIAQTISAAMQIPRHLLGIRSDPADEPFPPDE